MFLGMTRTAANFIGTVQQYCVHTDGSRHVILASCACFIQSAATSCSSSSAVTFPLPSFPWTAHVRHVSCGLMARSLFSNSATAFHLRAQSMMLVPVGSADGRRAVRHAAGSIGHFARSPTVSRRLSSNEDDARSLAALYGRPIDKACPVASSRSSPQIGCLAAAERQCLPSGYNEAKRGLATGFGLSMSPSGDGPLA